MNLQDLQTLINRNSKPELSKMHGSVYQVWEDGEITIQRSGNKLWLGSLTTLEAPVRHMPTLGISWPNKPDAFCNMGNIFTDAEGAHAVRSALLNYLSR